MDCYIYYKSTEENTENIIHAVARLNALLVPHLTKEVQLQRRPHLHDGQITWMEIYKDIPDHFESILSQATQDCGIHALISNQRHVEYFHPIAISF